MAETSFVIRFGAYYLDSEGQLHPGTPPSVPTYPTPGGPLPFDPDKVANVFKGIGDALPNSKNSNQYRDVLYKLGGIGAAENLIAVLGVIGLIVSTISIAFAAVGAVIMAAQLLGLLKEGPSALETLVKQRFDALERQFRSLSHLIEQRDLRTRQNSLHAAVAEVFTHVNDRDAGTLTPAQLEADHVALSNSLAFNTIPVIEDLLDVVTYEVLFDPSEIDRVWRHLSNVLHTLPSGQPPQPARFPATNDPVFDQRLAIPLGADAAQTLLGLVRGLSPEFRTTGDFREAIRQCANKLSSLAESIRNTVLARTIYKATDFSLVYEWEVHDVLGIPHISPTARRWPVGAMNLRDHDNTVFKDVYYLLGFQLPLSLFTGFKRAGLNFGWTPPAVLAPGPGTQIKTYVITNPQECADAANAASEQDYADLLVSSGYMSLAHLTAVMRHSATQPDRSETVHGGIALLRKDLPGDFITIQSDPIPLSDPVEALAHRVPQSIRAIATCSTQSPLRTRPIHYRIVVRTLPSIADPHLWVGPDYNAVQSPGYIKDETHPGFFRLVLETNTGAALGEFELVNGSSPQAPLRGEATVTLPAHTFDWWIPSANRRVPGAGDVAWLPGVPTVPHRPGDVAIVPKWSLSGTEVALPTQTRKLIIGDDMGIGSAEVFAGVGWTGGEEAWPGQRRELSEATIELRCRWEWLEDRFQIQIENRPKDRNYVVFLVFEETFGTIEDVDLPRKPKILHTPFAIPINGQVTHVPKSFFDQEQKSHDRLNAVLSDFANRYAISKRPGRRDPVLGWTLPGQLSTDQGRRRLVDAASRHAPDLWSEVLRGHGLRHG